MLAEIFYISESLRKTEEEEKLRLFVLNSAEHREEGVVLCSTWSNGDVPSFW